MTATMVSLVVTALVLVAFAAHWVTSGRAYRDLEARARGLDERTEQQRVATLERSASERRASAEAAQELEVVRVARSRDAADQEAALTAVRHRAADREATRLLEVVRAADREQQLASALVRSEERTRLLGAVCRVEGRAVAPQFPGRPAPVELDAVTGRVRGLAFIDSVSIADASGLPLDRGANRDADDLAALVPTVGRIADELAPILGDVSAIAIHTVDARVAEFRALPAWTGGAWLVAQSSAQRPPAGALDAAVAYARVVRDAWSEPPRTVALTERGRVGASGARTELLADELDRACRGLDARTIALVLGEQVLTGVQADGVAPDDLAVVLRALHQLQQVARARLRADGIARIEVDLGTVTRLSLSSLGNGSRLGFVTLTVGRTLDSLEVERVVGRLRRFMDTSAAANGGASPGALANGNGTYA